MAGGIELSQVLVEEMEMCYERDSKRNIIIAVLYAVEEIIGHKSKKN